MPDTELELDVSVLETQGKVYSSLTDINGIPIFTTAFKEDIEQFKEEEKKSDEYFNSLAFSENMKKSGTEEELSQYLFRGQIQQVVKEEEAEESIQTSVYPFLAAAFIIFFIIMGWYWKRRNKKTEEKKKALGETPEMGIKGEHYGQYE